MSSGSEPVGWCADLFLALTTAVWLVTRRKAACSARSVLELQRPVFCDFSVPAVLKAGGIAGRNYLQVYVSLDAECGETRSVSYKVLSSNIGGSFCLNSKRELKG